MTLMLLVRHGANDWVHGRLAGWTPGVHLNDEGRRQAASTAARLAMLPIDAIYTSPLDRTVETAQAIAGPRGLFIQRVEGPAGEPRRCVFFGPGGCTLPPERRAATCNYYVCEDALAEGGAEAPAARRARDTLEDALGKRDREIGARVAERWPEGPPWDEAFLDWLAAELDQGSAIVTT